MGLLKLAHRSICLGTKNTVYGARLIAVGLQLLLHELDGCPLGAKTGNSRQKLG